MTYPSERDHPFKHPEQAESDLTGSDSQDREGLTHEVADRRHGAAVDFRVVNDERSSIYEAIVGDTEIAGLPYNVESDDRIVLLATSVVPEFRNMGVATELIRRVLDDVRTRRKTVSVMCPIVHAFIERNPDYADLVDSEHPGVTNRARRA